MAELDIPDIRPISGGYSVLYVYESEKQFVFETQAMAF
jgi:hypothetical protein